MDESRQKRLARMKRYRARNKIKAGNLPKNLEVLTKQDFHLLQAKGVPKATLRRLKNTAGISSSSDNDADEDDSDNEEVPRKKRHVQVPDRHAPPPTAFSSDEDNVDDLGADVGAGDGARGKKPIDKKRRK